LIAILVAVGVLALLFLGAPLFAVLLTAGTLGAGFTSAGPGRTYFGDFGGQISDIFKLGTTEHASILATIPLFIFAGYLMAEAKTADRLVRVTRAGLAWLPGGLGLVTIFAFALFTTFTGASGVTIVALGALLYPSLVKERYPRRFSLGVIGGTGSVGLLFPPAVPLFVDGTIYCLTAQTTAGGGGTELELIDFQTSRFIFAGIVPGLVLVSILSMYAIAVAIRRGVPRHRFQAAEFARGFVTSLPEIAIPVLVIAGIASGINIPEVAALCAVYVIVLEIFVYRDVPLRRLWHVAREAMTLTGAIFIIIFAAAAFTNFLVTAEVPQAVFRWITANIDSWWVFLIALNLFLLVVGMTMDIFSAIVVVVPLIAPAAAHFGIDPYHLGIIFLLNLELGYLTPPVGLNLFITGFAFKKPILEVVRATLPFLGCMFIALMLVTYVPQLTVVPPAERRGRVSQLANDVSAAYVRVTSIDEIALPDGTVLARAECDEFQDPLQRDSCVFLFTDVTRCRAEAGGAVGSPCEVEKIEAYLEHAEDDDPDDDPWSFDDEDEDEGAEQVSE
jgi:C4-dicarboxylate transporter, DctM subunit